MRIRRIFPLLCALTLLLCGGCFVRLRADYPAAGTAVWQEHCAEIRVPLPEGWTWEPLNDPPSGRRGIRFWPEAEPEIWCETSFHAGAVGLCLVGEHPVRYTLRSGQSALCLSHSQNCFLLFYDTPGDYTAQIYSTSTDPDDYLRWNPAFLAVLNRAELGGDWLREDDARAIVCAAAGPDCEAHYGFYDWLDGSWTFYANSNSGERWRVDADGAAERLGPPE